jgi:hypothetical protein
MLLYIGVLVMSDRISLHTLGFIAQLRRAQSQTLYLITRETVVKLAIN